MFLQDIDSLLKSGEVPDLYAVDERQEIVEVRRFKLVLGRVLAYCGHSSYGIFIGLL